MSSNKRNGPPSPVVMPTGGFSTRSAFRLHGDIANHLGKAIVAGRYAPGELLPGEIEASEQAKVSRSAWREGVRTLGAKGLVERRPKAGTRVSARECWNLLDPDVVRWFFEDREPPEYYLRGLFELREVIEPAAAGFAAQRRSAEQLLVLRGHLDRMRSATLATAAGQEADRLFHATLLQATGNAVLISLASGIGAAVNWTTDLKARMRHMPRDPIVEHERVFRAVEASDATRARQEMRALVEQAFDDIELARE